MYAQCTSPVCPRQAKLQGIARTVNIIGDVPPLEAPLCNALLITATDKALHRDGPFSVGIYPANPSVIIVLGLVPPRRHDCFACDGL
jgi:hypothetical protein